LTPALAVSAQQGVTGAAQKASWFERTLAEHRERSSVPKLRQSRDREGSEIIDWIATLREGDPNPVESALRQAAQIRAQREAQLAAQVLHSPSTTTETRET